VTAPSAAGSYPVTAAYSGGGIYAASTGGTTLTVTAGPAATVTVTGGDDQSATTGQAFATPLSVAVTDAYGNPVAGATVTFTIASGSADFGGTAQSATAVTNGSGIASVATLTAGTTAGPVTVTAATPGASGTVSTTFTETVVSSGPARADLAITMTAPASLAPGATGTVTLTVTNKGPDTASDVVTGLTVSRGLTIANAGGGTIRDGVDFFTASALAAGAKLTYTVTVKAGPAKATVLLITGTGSATRDPDLLNNIAAAIVKIT